MDVTIQVDDTDELIKGFKAIAQALGVVESQVKDKVRLAEQGTRVELGGHSVLIVEKTKKRLSPPSEEVNAPQRTRLSPNETASGRVYEMYLGGMTVEQIIAAWPNPIQRASVQNYIQKGVQITPDADLPVVAERVGLTNPELRRTIRDVVTRAFAEGGGGGGRDEMQQFCVDNNLPPNAPDDWEVAWRASAQLFSRMNE